MANRLRRGQSRCGIVTLPDGWRCPSPGQDRLQFLRAADLRHQSRHDRCVGQERRARDRRARQGRNSRHQLGAAAAAMGDGDPRRCRRRLHLPRLRAEAAAAAADRDAPVRNAIGHRPGNRALAHAQEILREGQRVRGRRAHRLFRLAGGLPLERRQADRRGGRSEGCEDLVVAGRSGARARGLGRGDRAGTGGPLLRDHLQGNRRRPGAATTSTAPPRSMSPSTPRQ